MIDWECLKPDIEGYILDVTAAVWMVTPNSEQSEGTVWWLNAVGYRWHSRGRNCGYCWLFGGRDPGFAWRGVSSRMGTVERENCGRLSAWQTQWQLHEQNRKLKVAELEENYMAAFLCYPHVGQEKNIFLLFLFITALIPFLWARPSWTNYLPEPHLLIPSHWRIRFQHANLGGTQTVRSSWDPHPRSLIEEPAGPPYIFFFLYCFTFHSLTGSITVHFRQFVIYASLLGKKGHIPSHPSESTAPSHFTLFFCQPCPPSWGGVSQSFTMKGGQIQALICNHTPSWFQCSIAALSPAGLWMEFNSDTALDNCNSSDWFLFKSGGKTVLWG